MIKIRVLTIILCYFSICRAADPEKSTAYKGRFQALVQRVVQRWGIAQQVVVSQAYQNRNQLRDHLAFRWGDLLQKVSYADKVMKTPHYFMQMLYNLQTYSDELKDLFMESKGIPLPNGEVEWVLWSEPIDPDSPLWNAIRESILDGYSPYSAVIVSPEYSTVLRGGKTLMQKKMLMRMLQKAGVRPTEKDYEMSHLDLWERSAQERIEKSALVFAWQQQCEQGIGIGALPEDVLKLTACLLGLAESLLPEGLELRTP